MAETSNDIKPVSGFVLNGATYEIEDSSARNRIDEIDTDFVHISGGDTIDKPINFQASADEWSGLRILHPTVSANRINLEYDIDKNKSDDVGERGLWINNLTIPKNLTANSGEGLDNIGSWFAYVGRDNRAHFYGDSLYQRLMHTNEVNFTNTPSANHRFWFNYRDGDTETSAESSKLITEYCFGNRAGTVSGVTLSADTFAGNSVSAVSAKINGTHLGTGRTIKLEQNTESAYNGLQFRSTKPDYNTYNLIKDNTGFTYPVTNGENTTYRHSFGSIFEPADLGFSVFDANKLLCLTNNAAYHITVSPDTVNHIFYYSMPITNNSKYLTILNIDFDLTLVSKETSTRIEWGAIPIFRLVGNGTSGPEFTNNRNLPWCTTNSTMYSSTCIGRFIKGTAAEVQDFNLSAHRPCTITCYSGPLIAYNSTAAPAPNPNTLNGLICINSNWNMQQNPYMRVFGNITTRILTDIPPAWQA